MAFYVFFSKTYVNETENDSFSENKIKNTNFAGRVKKVGVALWA